MSTLFRSLLRTRSLSIRRVAPTYRGYATQLDLYGFDYAKAAEDSEDYMQACMRNALEHERWLRLGPYDGQLELSSYLDPMRDYIKDAKWRDLVCFESPLTGPIPYRQPVEGPFDPERYIRNLSHDDWDDEPSEYEEPWIDDVDRHSKFAWVR